MAHTTPVTGQVYTEIWMYYKSGYSNWVTRKIECLAEQAGSCSSLKADIRLPAPVSEITLLRSVAQPILSSLQTHISC